MQYNKEKNKKWWEEHFFKLYLGVSISILIIFTILEITNINILIERAITVFSFWILLFLIIFLPRRLIKRSRKFRYMILYVRKKNPIILYYWKRITILSYVNFLFIYVRYYVNRIFTYLLVGTKIKWLKPYRKSWERGEKIRRIIDEIMMVIHYLILYVFKIFYEVINFLDNATIYKIVRSRILGYMLVTIGYIVIGVNFFLLYILSLLIGFIFYHILRIYTIYMEFQKDFPSVEKWVNFHIVLVIWGFANKLEYFLKIELKEYRIRSFIYSKVIKNKRLLHDTLYKRLYIKYGGKKTTKLMLDLIELMEVEEKTLISKSILKQWEKIKEEDIEKLNFIQISKYKFTTKFLIKRAWYEEKIVVYKDKEFNDYYFTDALENIVCHANFLHLKLHLIYSILMNSNVWDINNEFKEGYDWWKEQQSIKEIYYKHYINYFEFKEIIRFLKAVEKKMEEYGGSNKFLKNFYIDNNLYSVCKSVSLADLNKKERKFLYILLFLSLFQVIEDIYEKDLKEIFEFYKEEINTLEKDVFGRELKKKLLEITKIKIE